MVFALEFEEFLNISLQQNDLVKYFREDLHRRLLSTDFKKQVDGIEMLHKVFLLLI